MGEERERRPKGYRASGEVHWLDSSKKQAHLEGFQGRYSVAYCDQPPGSTSCTRQHSAQQLEQQNMKSLH